MTLAARVAALAAAFLVHTVSAANVHHASPAADFSQDGFIISQDCFDYLAALFAECP